MKNSNKITLSIVIIVLFSFTGCRKSKSDIDKTVVSNLTLEKYLGKWYEIARYENKFEKGLEKVTAEYSLRDDGKIKVVNSGYNVNSGDKKIAVGKAKVPDKAKPSHLKVSFFAFFYADYLILELGNDYQWAVVGSSSDNYLWILSRTPELSENTLKDILHKIQVRGYNTEKLLYVRQK